MIIFHNMWPLRLVFIYLSCYYFYKELELSWTEFECFWILPRFFFSFLFFCIVLCRTKQSFSVLPFSFLIICCLIEFSQLKNVLAIICPSSFVFQRSQIWRVWGWSGNSIIHMRRVALNSSVLAHGLWIYYTLPMCFKSPCLAIAVPDSKSRPKLSVILCRESKKLEQERGSATGKRKFGTWCYLAIWRCSSVGRVLFYLPWGSGFGP